MLEDLMLPWTTFPDTCRWAIPLAALSAILIRLSQSSGVRPDPLLPAKTTTGCCGHLSPIFITVKRKRFLIPKEGHRRVKWESKKHKGLWFYRFWKHEIYFTIIIKDGSKSMSVANHGGLWPCWWHLRKYQQQYQTLRHDAHSCHLTLATCHLPLANAASKRGIPSSAHHAQVRI